MLQLLYRLLCGRVGDDYLRELFDWDLPRQHRCIELRQLQCGVLSKCNGRISFFELHDLRSRYLFGFSSGQLHWLRLGYLSNDHWRVVLF